MRVCEAGLSAWRAENAELVVFFENSHPKATPGTHRGLSFYTPPPPNPGRVRGAGGQRRAQVGRLERGCDNPIVSPGAADRKNQAENRILGNRLERRAWVAGVSAVEPGWGRRLDAGGMQWGSGPQARLAVVWEESGREVSLTLRGGHLAQRRRYGPASGPLSPELPPPWRGSL